LKVRNVLASVPATATSAPPAAKATADMVSRSTHWDGEQEHGF